MRAHAAFAMVLATGIALVITACGARPAAAAVRDTTPPLGVYVGANQPAKVASFEKWSGRPVERALDYLADDTWQHIASPTWWTEGWGASPWRSTMIYSVPMLPAAGGTLAGGAAGLYDANFAQLARTLVAAGQGNAVIRVGWESNGGWYRWSAARDPAAWVAYYRRIVTTMRAVGGAHFTFDWSVSMGTASIAPPALYPGDAFVDVIGMDVYDQYWGPSPADPAARWRSYLEQPYGLKWHAAFARTHGKPMAYPEWGVIWRADGHGGGDDPYFVARMAEWFRANPVAYAIYFNADTPVAKSSLDSGQFPKSAAAFRTAFAAAPVAQKAGLRRARRPPARRRHARARAGAAG